MSAYRKRRTAAAVLLAAAVFLTGCGGILTPAEMIHQPEPTQHTLDFEDYADWKTRDWESADDAGRWQAVKAMLEHIDPQAFAGVSHGVMVEQLNRRIAAEVEKADRFFADTDGMFTLRYHAEQVQRELSSQEVQ